MEARAGRLKHKSRLQRTARIQSGLFTMGSRWDVYTTLGVSKRHFPWRDPCRTQVSRVSNKGGQARLLEEEKSRRVKREAEDAKQHQLHGFVRSTGGAGAIKLAYNKVCTSLTKPVSFDRIFCSSCTA